MSPKVSLDLEDTGSVAKPLVVEVPALDLEPKVNVLPKGGRVKPPLVEPGADSVEPLVALGANEPVADDAPKEKSKDGAAAEPPGLDILEGPKLVGIVGLAKEKGFGAIVVGGGLKVNGLESAGRDGTFEV